jgi:hypothetical protein
VCKEFVFVLEFFDLKMAHMSRLFNQIFAKIINKYIDWLKDYNALANQHQDVLLQGIANVQDAASLTASKTGGLDIFALLLCI